MSIETLQRAIEPFYSTKGIGKGTGLGLSSIHGFAEQLGGTFLLKSKVGIGTTAEIWLPIAKLEPDRKTVATANLALPDGKPLTILAVDDDAIILMNTAALLEDMSHTVFEATSADEAIDLFRSHPEIELIITDYAMPGKNGMQLAEQVSAERPGMPVILATGYGEISSDSSFKIQRLGKPFNRADLRLAIVTAMVPPRDTNDVV